MIRPYLDHILTIPKRTVLLTIRFYQKTFSPDHGFGRIFFPFGCCRFRPTCSQYAYEAVSAHGVIRGLLLATWRLSRCHPWAKGGHDPVPKRWR